MDSSLRGVLAGQSVARRGVAAPWKTVGLACVGSNPTPATDVPQLRAVDRVRPRVRGAQIRSHP